MRTSVLLRGASSLLVGWLGACSTDPCAKYADLPFARERCLVVQAPGAADIAAARCEQAGAAEEDCRITWVETHLDRPVDGLLAACSTPECRFIALDFRPSPLGEQLPRCERLGPLATSCVLHGFVRYYGGDPTPGAQAVDLAALGAWARVGAVEAASARSCGHAVDCAVFGADAPLCETPPSRPVDCTVYRPTFPRGRESGTGAQPIRASP